MSRSCLFALICAAFLCVPALVPAQSTVFIASVADAATGAPLKDADVVLMDLHLVARTNWLGEARFPGVGAGNHRVRVRKLGYVAADLTLPFHGDSVGQVFMLAESPRGLDTVHIRATRVPAYLQPFENRRKLGIGRFLTSDDLLAEGARNMERVALARFPGLTLGRDDSGHEILLNVRGYMTHVKVTQCPVLVYLDGDPITQDDVWDLTRTWDLAGAEYYDGVDTPVQYRVDGSVCGVLLLWTRWN